MKALLFQYSIPRMAAATILGKINPRAYMGPGRPLNLVDLPDPEFPADDWVLVRTRKCGICGSEVKPVFLKGNFDNPMTAFISFPQVMGHEAVGVIEKIGPRVKTRRVGERVVLNPWLSCITRGIDPPCEACLNGHPYLCEHFTDGYIAPGIHIGNNRDVTGGFGTLFTAHESRLHPIPDGVSFDQALLADPFSVSLHAILKAPPPQDSLAVVYGCGTLGLLTIMILQKFFPSVDIFAVTLFPHQEKLAQKLGAKYTIRTREPVDIIERIAEIMETKLYSPWGGKPVLMRGPARIYDTVGSPETLEVGIRIAQPRAKIVVSGVDTPSRFEWTPLYFKEIEVIGSNAFGIETFQGKREHSYDIFLKLLEGKQIDLNDFITHRYPLDNYKQAFLDAYQHSRSEAVKVIFEY